MDFETYMREQSKIAEAKWLAEHSQAQSGVHSNTSTQTTATLPPQVEKPRKSTSHTSTRSAEKLNLSSQSSSSDEDKTPVPKTRIRKKSISGSDSNVRPSRPANQKRDKKRREALAESGDDAMKTPRPLPTKRGTGQAGDGEMRSKSSTIAGYKDRKALTRRMKLDPSNKNVRLQIRERRDFIKMQCIRRSAPLEKPFEEFPSDIMYKLVKNVTYEMQTQYGGWWDQDLTRDIIHAICLDKVRNTNAKGRPRKAAAKNKPSGSHVDTGPFGDDNGTDDDAGPSIVNAKKSKRVRRTVLSESEASDTQPANKRRPPGTAHKGALPPPLLPHLLGTKAIDPITPVNPVPPKALNLNAITEGLSQESQVSQGLSQASPPDAVVPVFDIPSSPLLGSSPAAAGCNSYSDQSPLARKLTSTSEVTLAHTSEMSHSFFDDMSGSQYHTGNGHQQQEEEEEEDEDEIPETPPSKVSETPPPSNKFPPESAPTVTVFIKGCPPLYVPHNALYQEFEDTVRQRLKWGDDSFLLYRPTSGSKQQRQWKAVGRDKDWRTIVMQHGESGVFVKVAEDTWFKEPGLDDEPEDDDDVEARDYIWKGKGIEGKGNGNAKAVAPIVAPSAPARVQKHQPVPPILEAPQARAKNMRASQSKIKANKFQEQPRPERVKRQQKISGEDQSQLLEGITEKQEPEKRKRGRPRKNPLPSSGAPAIEETSPEIGSSSVPTTTKSGRVIRKSEKACQALAMEAQKYAANQAAITRSRLKKMREDFTI